MKPIFLIGYMGSGKTTLGRAVSTAASLPFIDLDEFIEQRKGMTVKEIFAAEGEEGFRRAEREALHELADGDGLIVACGGGTPCFFDNIGFMNRRGTTVYLDASLEALHRRLCAMRSGRPLIAAKSDDEIRAFIVESLAQRMPFYGQAAFRFDSDRLETPEEVAQSVDEFVAKFLPNHHI